MEITEKLYSEALTPDNFRGVYADIANIIGIDALIKLHKHYRGQSVLLPINLFSCEYISKCICEEYNGKNIKQLATEYGYSEKWIRKIIKDNQNTQ